MSAAGEAMSFYAKLAAAIAVGLLIAAAVWKHSLAVEAVREEGREEIRQAMTKAALIKSEANAKESLRRIERQEENQRAQNAELERLRAAAARSDAAARRVREQADASARKWSARLADSPTAADLAAASEAIRVCTDLRGRADRRAGILARYADAARTAGAKCEADYDALTPEEN
jgi:leucyl aminopeptidase (aminopeptidase T)